MELQHIKTTHTNYIYQRYATKHNKGNLTIKEFNNEIIQSPNVKCQNHNGVEYYTNLKYKPLNENDDEFFQLSIHP